MHESRGLGDVYKRQGVKVDYRDADAFLAAASELAKDGQMWPAMRRNARRTSEGLSWTAIIDAFEARLEQVVGGAHRPAATEAASP